MRKDSQWVSIGEAAKYLGVSRDTLRRWEKKGKIKAVRSPTNRRYYTQDQLDQLMSGKESDQRQLSRRPERKKIGRKPKLILVGALSFLIATLLALLLQFLLLG